jgi:glycerophosphoryl diester phosphodiesterase
LNSTPPRPAPSPRNIAHRGSSFFAPENTRPAFERALNEDGAEGLEIDVHLGGDGEVYALHDPTVDRTTNGAGPLRLLDAKQIEELDAGYRFTTGGGEFSFRDQGVRVPRLRELLSEYQDTWFSIDLKEGGVEIEAAVARILLEGQCLDRCVIGAENPEASARLRHLLPHPSRHFFDRRAVRNFYLRHRTRCWAGYRAPGSSLQIPTRAGRWALDRSGLVDDAHARGLSVLYWTVDEPAAMRDLLALGADGIITNRPDLLRDLLAEFETQ